MSYFSKKTKLIRKELKRGRKTPKFEPEKWEGMYTTNCYAYALDLPISDPKTLVFIPGNIGNESSERENRNIWTSTDLVEGVKRDLDFLGISYREDDISLKKGEYRIAIYVIPTVCSLPIGFHFVRQDETGEWSHKPSWKSEVKNLGKAGNGPPDLSYGQAWLESVLIGKK